MLSLKQQVKEYLKDVSISQGERIGILSENRIECIALILALWEAGAVVVPVSTRYTPVQINIALNDANCNKLFVSSEFANIEVTANKHSIDSFAASDETELPAIMLNDINVDLEEDASVIFTSGSSGSPKGVLHTFSNHYFNALGSDLNIPFRKGDRWLMSLPLYHISGFSLIMRSLLNGGTIVFPRQNESICDSIRRCDITHLSLVPVQLVRLMANPECLSALNNLKAILLGGSAIPAKLIDKAIDNGLPIHITYGSTEMASQVATSAEPFRRQAKMLKYREAIVSVAGEVCVKGKTLFQGYVKGDCFSLPLDDDGYFHTGDLGSIDAEGNLTVIGRKDLMFISGGENIHPQQIEKSILAIDHVEAAIVVAVKSSEFGQRPVAFIKMFSGHPLDIPGIKSSLCRTLEKFKIPDAVYDWPDDQSSIKPQRDIFQELAESLNL